GGERIPRNEGGHESVEYRLAPGTPFPGSLEDNYAALRWTHTNAKEMGIDTKRIAVKGESAGGGHAAALAIAARGRREFAICKQILIQPMLDDRTWSSRSVPVQFGRLIWTAESNRRGWAALLGMEPGGDLRDSGLALRRGRARMKAGVLDAERPQEL